MLRFTDPIIILAVIFAIWLFDKVIISFYLMISELLALAGDEETGNEDEESKFPFPFYE